jgi:hypothetical protein
MDMVSIPVDVLGFQSLLKGGNADWIKKVAFSAHTSRDETI